jgi:protein-S-isoprenylcysteine O-methyltransferase Ste14
MNAVEIALLLFGTVSLLIMTWRVSLKAGRYHGVYRFVSFESILILFLLNWRYWFDDPFSWHQIVAWVLLIGSIVPAVVGFRLLRVVGRPEGQFENTTSLVKVGAYGYIRHPLYASLILLGLGIFFKELSGIGAILALVNVGAMVATARREEKEMVDKFGSEYTAYMLETKMFIPHVF